MKNSISGYLRLSLALFAMARPALAHEPMALPLGDGKISDKPQQGSVFACPTRFSNSGGAYRAGSWIVGNWWYPERKPHVEGSVEWPNSSISVTVSDGFRIVRANGLPSHQTGRFPIDPGTEAYKYDRNPNQIREQLILLRLPAAPIVAANPGCVPMGMVGFALSGVAIFNAFDLQGRDAAAHEIQDKCNGHPEIASQYHYHEWSPCLRGRRADAPVGWMLDGFPILGPTRADGSVVRNRDLDVCHGTTGPVYLDGKMVTIYHYRFTYEYPYTIGCFRGAMRFKPR